MFTPKHYSIINNILYYIRYYRKYEPAVLFLSGIEIILGAFLPLFGIYLPRIAVGLVLKEVTAPYAVFVLGMFTLTMMAARVLAGAASAGKYHLYNMQRANQVGLLFLKSLRVPYSYVESGGIKQLYWRAYQSLEMGDLSASSRMVTGTVGIIVNILCFVLYSTVIGMLSGALLIFLVGLAILNYLIHMRQIRYEESLRDEQAQVRRQCQCVKNSMGHVKGAKDIRIFNMSNWLIKLRDITFERQSEVDRKLFLKRSFYEKIGFLLSFVRDFAAYAFLLRQAMEKEVSAGEFVFYFGAITGFSCFLLSIMNSLSELRQAADYSDCLRTYMELPEENVDGGVRHIKELSMPLEIEFVNVSFSYKDICGDMEHDKKAEADEGGKCIFKNLNLTIHAGEKIALVGVNGAGKTTFVKLLCGMYEPDEGNILLNGIDRNLFPKEELYGLFSVVFQEQLILPFTVGENIAMVKEECVDRERAWDALEKAGLKPIFEEKKIGLDSFMTKKLFEDGVDLSGGQQQRFLLARALYKDAPVLVLDEPTAALDPIAESEVYDNYNKYSGGKTAVFISHRLASTKFSDRIILLEDGVVAQMGTHDELMGQRGKYAEMFKIQSSYYDKKTVQAGEIKWEQI